MTKNTLSLCVSRNYHSFGLYFKIQYNGNICRIPTEFSIFEDEWDDNLQIIKMPKFTHPRHSYLASVNEELKWIRCRIESALQILEEKKIPYNTDNILDEYYRLCSDETLLFGYLRTNSKRLRSLGKIRSSETLMSALFSFLRFRKGVDIAFSSITSEIIQQYEAWLIHDQGLVRNTSSFYIRILKTYYRKAVEESLTVDRNPFRQVYAGIDRTAKRAISLEHIKVLSTLFLDDNPELAFARDMFMMSFYLRGMSFVDMSYLRKKDLQGGILCYRRRKTGQLLEVKWEAEMQRLLDRYPKNRSKYLLPIITIEDGTERDQYLNAILRVNRALKKIAILAGIESNISTYTARHTWASVARDMRVDLPVISKALGHNNQITTSIYLSDIKSEEVDMANKNILSRLS